MKGCYNGFFALPGVTLFGCTMLHFYFALNIDKNEASRFGYGVLHNLFTTGKYDASKVTANMSIDFGIRWAIFKVNINGMNRIGDELIQNYNGGYIDTKGKVIGDPNYWKKVKYAMANPVDYHYNKDNPNILNWNTMYP